MFQFCSLYSGSSGNSLYIKSDETNILIDAGVSMRQIEKALNDNESSLANIDAVLVTHEHSDHIKSVASISRKYNIPIFANEKTLDAIGKNLSEIPKDNIKTFSVSKKFDFKDMEIEPFSVPHDAYDPCGFNIYHDHSKISIATDLGHVSETIVKYLEKSSFLMLEANYDPEILKYGSYPYFLKNRISGPNGHLPNYIAGKTICSLIEKGLNSVLLGHLSKENNFPELAYQTVVDELIANHYKEDHISLNVASRTTPGKLIDVC